MALPRRVRRTLVVTHIVVALGWIGANAAYIAVDAVAATSQDTTTLRGAYLAMDTMAGTVIVPLALATLVTGIAVSLGTKWGILRHYWVLISLVLTSVATTVLLVEMGTIAGNAALAADPATSADELNALGSTLVHSIGGTFVLLLVLLLNTIKPGGLTRYRQRQLHR